jgi:methionyl-tRNA formyltransferase
MTSPLTKPISVVFLGSFLEYSTSVLQALHNSPLIEVIGVITTPPKPAGRKKILKKTHVHLLAEELKLPVFAPQKATKVALPEMAELFGFELEHPPQVLLTAGYGKLLPSSWLELPTVAALNLHFSLLPAYRGANPAEWAMLRNEKKTGVTVIKMSPEFDTGGVIASATHPIATTDTRETIYDALYRLGGKILPQVITDFAANKLPIQPQPKESPTPYAKRLNREDGFIDWKAITQAMNGTPIDPSLLAPQLKTILEGAAPATITAETIERSIRALAGFPGVWSIIQTVKGEKRIKLLSASAHDTRLTLRIVQIEGQQPAQWNQVKSILK